MNVLTHSGKQQVETVIVGVPVPKDMGHTPPFRPEEIVKDFWQWMGNVYVERPEAGGPKVHPTLKRPIRANMLDESKYGRLWELTFEWRRNYFWGDDPTRRVTIRVLNVWNATLEKDGTRQQFTLRVPRNMSTAHEAVAWTFGMRPDQYNPSVET